MGEEPAIPAQRLVWWIMGGLLALTMTIGGWWARDLQHRLELTQQRLESLSQAGAARGERLVELSAKVTGLEPRVSDLAGKVGAMEGQQPLVAHRVNELTRRLEAIDGKLDRLLDARPRR